MNYQIQLTLIGVVALIVLITFFINIRIRNKRRSMLRSNPEPRLGKLNEFENLNTGVNSNQFQHNDSSEISLRHSKSRSAVAKEPIAKTTHRSFAGLGLDELDSLMQGHLKNQDLQHQQAKFTHQETYHKKNSAETQKLIVMHVVVAQQGNAFVGYELLQTLLAIGLRYGEMSIFHRYQQSTGQGKRLFSLASATEPGIFDMNKMGAFSCRGLSLFMQLTGPEHNEQALETMINTAYQIAEDLNGIVLNENRKPLDKEKIAEYQAKVQAHLASL